MQFFQYFLLTLLSIALLGAVFMFLFTCANIVTDNRFRDWIARRLDKVAD